MLCTPDAVAIALCQAPIVSQTNVLATCAGISNFLVRPHQWPMASYITEECSHKRELLHEAAPTPPKTCSAPLIMIHHK